MNKIDYVKQYRGNLNQIPSELRHIVVEKYKEQGGDVDDILSNILDVDVYISIDLKNFWRKKQK